MPQPADFDPVAKLKEKLAQTGSISSADIANLAPDSDTPTPDKEVDEPPQPKLAADPLAEAAEALVQSNDWNDKPVALLPEDKEAFKHSLATMTRFTRSVSLFGGSLRVTFRTRTTAESDAIANWQRILVQHSLIPPEAIQAHLRAGLLAAQVERLNGQNMPALAGPLFAAVSGKNADGSPKFTAPKWHAAAVARWIDDTSPGLVNELMRELLEFERVYYTLLAGARNQNF